MMPLLRDALAAFAARPNWRRASRRRACPTRRSRRPQDLFDDPHLAATGGLALVGQTAGFSGPVAAGVEETTAGARLVIDAVNAAGGIDGERIELVSLDDGFVP
jgi:ABC-type branched-subunit amino acid transport system substrate-binding protein